MAATLYVLVGLPTGQGSWKKPPGTRAPGSAAAFSSAVGGKTPPAARLETPSGGFGALKPNVPGMKNGKPGVAVLGEGGGLMPGTSGR